MKEDIFFERCGNGQGDTLNIFIHGYSAASTESDRDKLKNYITKANSRDSNVFAFWPSGSMLDNFCNVDLLGAALKPNPYLFVVNAIASQIGGFKAIEQSINNLKYKFYVLLSRFLKKNGTKYATINIYSHSLGVRLVIDSILAMGDEFKDLNINNLVFMAGARNLNNIECKKLLTVTSGNIYNIHSDTDLVLKIKPDLEKCIGSHPIVVEEELNDRIINRPFHSLGHLDYWDNLHGIIKHLDFNNESRKEIMVISNDTPIEFSLKDEALYNVIYYSSKNEREVISKLLNKRNKSFSDSEVDTQALTNEIQLMGGDSIVNIIRGNGVKYDEILRDISYEIGIKNIKESRYFEIESMILDVMMNNFKKEVLTNGINKNKCEKIINAIDTYLNENNNDSIDVNVFIDIYDVTDSFRTVHFTGPATQVLIPIVILIKILRGRIIKNNDFLIDFVG
ncbi:hypothetical protein AB7038_04475 [Morganella morganii]|uniref:hypothetical protein n=1 Tax=Morganella morganii TaxID=582 RepID=UPI0034E5AC11